MPYDESTAEPLTEPDQNNHTKFYGNDESANFDGKKRLDGTATYEQHYSRLALLNSGVYNGKWADKTKLRENDNLGVFDAISGQLELSPHQKRIGRQAFSDLNHSELSSPDGIDTTLIAIMASAVVARPDGRIYHPNRTDESNDSAFVSLLAAFDYRQSVLRSAYGKVLNQISL